MSTITDYPDHVPHTEIYNNKEVISNGTAKANNACLIGIANLISVKGVDDNNLIKMVTAGTAVTDPNKKVVVASTAIPFSEWNILTNNSTNTIPSIFDLKLLDTASVEVWLFDQTAQNAPAQMVITTDYTVDASTGVTFTSTGIGKITTNKYALIFSVLNLQYKSNVNHVLTIAKPLDVDLYFGRSDPKLNPLAFACDIALSAGENTEFKAIVAKPATFSPGVEDYLAIEFDDSDSYASILQPLSNSQNIQFVAPVCKDAAFFSGLKAQVVADSTATSQKWKRAYLPSLVDVSGSSGTTIAATVAAESIGYSNARIINVFCDTPQYLVSSSSGTISTATLELPYLAAGIAALRSSLLPQQGISMYNLPFVFSCPNMYTKYTTENLNTMGAAGTFVVTQDGDYFDVYVRHALTTGVDKGILYYEDMVGVNTDDINYNIKSVISGFIGKRNNTDQTLTEIYNRVSDYFTSISKTNSTIEQITIGPQIKSFSDLTVTIDDNLRDRINVNVNVEIPLPINTIIVNINTYASL